MVNAIASLLGGNRLSYHNSKVLIDFARTLHHCIVIILPVTVSTADWVRPGSKNHIKFNILLALRLSRPSMRSSGAFASDQWLCLPFTLLITETRPKREAGMKTRGRQKEEISFADIEVRTAWRRGYSLHRKSLDEKPPTGRGLQYWQELFAHFQQSRGVGRAFLSGRATGTGGRLHYRRSQGFRFGSEPCGWVFALNVDPEIRVHNVGTQLFEALCETFGRAGVAKVRTMLNRDNHLVQCVFPKPGDDGGAVIQLEKELD